MKKSILFLALLFVFTACETGTRYDKNATVKKSSNKDCRGVVNQDIENLLRDHEGNTIVEETFEEPVAHQSYIEVDEQEDIFDGGEISDGLNVKKIRVGKHNGYTRLVLDVYDGTHKSNLVGAYSAKYYESRDDITVLLEGYRNFSAKFPSFSRNSVIEKMYFERYEDDSAYKFHIKLRQEINVRIFALENPARLVFDIKPI